eukprot:g31060.t1
MLEMTIRDMDAQQAEAALELQRMRARLLDGLCPSKLRRSERLKGLARRLAMLEQNVGREQAECVKVMEAVLATVERNGAVAEAVCQHLSGIATTRATTAAQMLPDPNIHQELAAKAAEEPRQKGKWDFGRHAEEGAANSTLEAKIREKLEESSAKEEKGQEKGKKKRKGKKVETKSEDPVESEPDADLSHWDRCSFGLGVGK